MTQIDVVAKRAEETVPSIPLMPIVPPRIGIGVWLLVLVALAVALYFMPISGVIAPAVIGIAVMLIWLVWQHPEAGLIVLIFMVTGFIPADVIDLRLPIGGLDLRDLCLIGMIGLLGLRQIIRRRAIMPWPPVSVPLLVFMILALCSTVYAIRYQAVENHWAFNELRILLYYTTFILTAWSITRPKQLVILLAGMFLMVDLVTAIIILQQFSGIGRHILAAMSTGSGWYIVEQGDPAAGFGTVRIVPPGQVLMVMIMVIAFCLMVSGQQKPRLRAACALQFAYINFGLLLTYTRGQWIASAIALGLATLALSSADKARLARYGLVAIVGLLVLYGAIGAELEQRTNFGAMLSERVGSIFTPKATLESASLQWRLFENEQAFRSISQHPLLGVGLGNAYRDITLLQGEARGWWGTLASGTYGRYTRYVHNSYLYVAVKMGIPGLLILLWFFAAFVFKGRHVLGNLRNDQFKRITLALLTSFIALLPWAMTQAHFMQIESAATIGLMAGLVAAMYGMEQRQVDDSSLGLGRAG